MENIDLLLLFNKHRSFWRVSFLLVPQQQKVIYPKFSTGNTNVTHLELRFHYRYKLFLSFIDSFRLKEVKKRPSQEIITVPWYSEKPRKN